MKTFFLCVLFWDINTENTDYSRINLFGMCVNMVKYISGKMGRDHVGISVGFFKDNDRTKLYLIPYDISCWNGRTAGFTKITCNGKTGILRCSSFYYTTIAEERYNSILQMFQRRKNQINYPPLYNIIYDFIAYNIKHNIGILPLNVTKEYIKTNKMDVNDTHTCSQFSLHILLQELSSNNTIYNKEQKIHINALETLKLQKCALDPWDIEDEIKKGGRNMYTIVVDEKIELIFDRSKLNMKLENLAIRNPGSTINFTDEMLNYSIQNGSL
jgi:hypothetical protein